MARVTLHDRSIVVHLVAYQAELRPVMVEICIGCPGRIEIIALMIRMAAVALVYVFDGAVSPIFLADLIRDAYVARQTKHVLRRFERSVAAAAIRLEVGVRVESLKRHARPAFCAQLAWTERHTAGAPQDNAQSCQQEGGQQETEGG